MNRPICTLRDAENEIQALIDSFTDAIFLEACETMVDSARVARDARIEETEDNDE